VLRDLVRVFEGLADNAQAFMAGVARTIELQQADIQAVIAFKQRLIEAVALHQVKLLLRSIACSGEDDGQAEAWVASTGAFRIGPLSGQWNKSAADYIGAASRTEARRRRFADIDAALVALALEEEVRATDAAVLAACRIVAEREWRGAPSDVDLRAAHVEARSMAHQRRLAVERLAQADDRLGAAAGRWRAAREQVMLHAADLGLPANAEGLSRAASALAQFERMLQDVLLQASDIRYVLPERARQFARVEEMRQDMAFRCEQ
jgi:hypothetical protein